MRKSPVDGERFLTCEASSNCRCLRLGTVRRIGNDLWVLDASDYFNLGTAFVALLYFYSEDPFQSLRPEQICASSSKPCCQADLLAHLQSQALWGQQTHAACCSRRKPHETVPGSHSVLVSGRQATNKGWTSPSIGLSTT